jgi:hypothetical protein
MSPPDRPPDGYGRTAAGPTLRRGRQADIRVYARPVAPVPEVLASARPGNRGGDGRRRRRRSGFGFRSRWWPAVAAILVAGVIWGLGRPQQVRADDTQQAASGPVTVPPPDRRPILGKPTAVEVDNPALNDIGDPYIAAVGPGVGGDAGPGYALYWTTDWTANVPTAVSTDLIHWRRVPDALPVLPPWALVVRPPGGWSAPAGVSTMTWGPTVHQVGDAWVLYYSTEAAASRRECLGAAYSSSPIGPFVDTSGSPLVCQAALGGDIDPSVVDAGAGHLALVWKNDGNANGTPVGIWEQPLSPDGRSVTGHPVRLLAADQAWEHHIIEGPAMLADSSGGWWLFYSGGTWQSDTYDTGVAWCATVAGPCRQPVDAPLISSRPTAVSPGGLDTFVDHTGHLWASYSAFPSHPADARAAMASPRVLELARVLSH